MGNTIWIEVRDRPGAETHEDLSVLHALTDQLDALAKRLGVTQPSAFYDYSPLLPVEEHANPTWFDANRGLESMTTLHAVLREDFGSLRWTPDASQQHWPESLLDELTFCERILAEAARDARAFRLMIVD
ncbi:MAG: hypothetical protein IPG50_28140 [Myxococcales bacterium]|nr:hypothetical protein [Myxococcales bacterium]